MIHYTQILRADLETLNAELAANGWNPHEDIDIARRKAIEMVHEANGPFYLMTLEGCDIVRVATLDEAIESGLVSDEGVIEVDGVKCFVQS